jgi:hypothetical protein
MDESVSKPMLKLMNKPYQLVFREMYEKQWFYFCSFSFNAFEGQNSAWFSIALNWRSDTLMLYMPGLSIIQGKFLRHLPECRHSSTFHSTESSPLVKYLIFFKVIPVK